MRAGVLPVDKAVGPTSHDVVALARRALGTRRIGHTGTLDPFASGLLLLCVGWATRLAEHLTGLPKTYRATARLGVRTDTDDRTGKVIAESDAWRRLSADEVTAALQRQMGERMQRPPAYSAKKVGGERAYLRARRGETDPLPAVPVRIDALALTAFEPPDVEFEVACSSGTYVRAIARDLGEELGVGAHLTALRRTRVGSVDVDQAVAADAFHDAARVEAAWIEPLDALGDLPRWEADAAAATELRHGRALEVQVAAGGATVAVAHEGRLLALARADGERLRPFKVFADDE